MTLRADLTTNVVHAILPGDIDDPATPSGGNNYDRRVCQQLTALGWSVREHALPGAWPTPGAADRAELARVLAALPDGAAVLLDGLVGCAAGEVLIPQRNRLRLVVLVHMPLATGTEAAALAAATAIVTTSGWSRRLLLDRYPLPAARVRVAPPGVEPAPLARESPDGTRLLCVAAVTPVKGHDVLATALAQVADLPWRCTCVGSLTRDPAYVGRLRRQLEDSRLADRVRLVGARVGAELDTRYADADLLVLASRAESYGMVVTEALVRGIPVLATAVGGVPEALGCAPDGTRPGVLVAADDPAALADALRRWLDDPQLRGRLRDAAVARRAELTRWSATAKAISEVISEAISEVISDALSPALRGVAPPLRSAPDATTASRPETGDGAR